MFTTYAFMDVTLTRWNNYTKTMGIHSAYAKTWWELKQMHNEIYYHIDEIQELQQDLAYAPWFDDLIMLCLGFVSR